MRNDLAVQTEQFIKQREELMNKLEAKEREFKEKTKLYEIQLETIRAENNEIVQKESEKSSMIINLSAEIEKLQIEKQEFVVVAPNNLSDGLLNFISKQEHEDMMTEINSKLCTAQSRKSCIFWNIWDGCIFFQFQIIDNFLWALKIFGRLCPN